MSSEEVNLITFNAISKFIKELSDLYGKKQRTLALYRRLLQRTTLDHEKAIQKNIDAFKKFCTMNRDAIKEKNPSKLNEEEIFFSNSARINMKDIFRFAAAEDKEIVDSIWMHILTISALVDPAGKAKEMLKTSVDQNASNEKEAALLNNIISSVERNVDENANPMQALTSIAQSGVINELVGNMTKGIKDGDLDFNRLMGTVSQVFSGLGQQPVHAMDPGDPEGEETMDMLNTMMSSFMGGFSQLQQSKDNEGAVISQTKTSPSLDESQSDPPADD